MSNPPDVRQGPKSESVQALKEVAAALLRQACQLLEQIIHGQDDGQGILTYESTLIPGSTIGKHLRHTLDHYRLLLESVPPSSSMAGPLEVNYDTRMRLLDMEGDPAVALRSFEKVERLLDAAADRMSLDKPVKLTALTPHHQEFESSFGRELWFVALHAIHHYSLLRVIATGELRMRLPDNFGVAPSTLAFREYAKATSGRSKEEKPEQAARGAEQLASKVKL